MTALRKTLVRQFARPTGVLGRLAGWIMERRPSNRERNLRTLDLLGIEPTDRVLEVGFGPGFALSRAAELASRGSVVGVDHSDVMVRRARRRNAAAVAEGRMELHCLGADELPLPEGSVDKAYAVNVAMFWREPVATLSGIRSVLRPGGRLAITHQPRNAGASDEDTRRSAGRIAEHLRSAGFEDVRIEILPMRPVSVACVLAVRPRTGDVQGQAPARARSSNES